MTEQTNLIFQLGILEEEYNKILYDSEVIPSPLPPTPHIPINTTSIYYYLKEDMTVYSDNNKDFRKFELGLSYEDTNGEIKKQFPSFSNKVFIYTIDGKFFFSEQYSDFQKSDFYYEFANGRVDFRPKTSWKGDFGMDWIRRGDFINVPASNDSQAISISYKEKIGFYYKPAPNNTVKILNEGEQPTTFKKQKEEWFKLKTLYSSFSLPFGNESLYNGSWSTLYPTVELDGTPSGFPKTTSGGNLKCLTESDFELIIEIISPPTSLKIRFEKELFEVHSIDPLKTTNLPDVIINKITYSELEINDKSITGTNPRRLDVHIKCLKAFSDFKMIKIITIGANLPKLAGQMTFIANIKGNRKKTKVTIVKVKTNLPLSTEHIGDPIGAENTISKFLSQALIDVDVEILTGSLNMATAPFNSQFADTLSDGTTPSVKIFPTAPTSDITIIHHELMKQLDIQYPSHNKDSFKIFFINELNEKLAGLAMAGIGITNDNAIVFKDGAGIDSMVAAHELLHCGGLYHSFSNLSYLTFENSSTDNLLDYSEPTIPTNATWKKQWEILWMHTLIEDE